MGTAAKAPPITIEQYEQFRGYPGLRDELIYGEIVMSPQPKPLHQQIAKATERLLDHWLEGSQWTAQRDTNIKFHSVDSMPSPDVFVVRRSDWKQACETDQYLSTPPVLAVEVLSPANRRARVAQKTELYLSNGVLYVWVVDPKKHTFAVYEGSKFITYGPGSFVPLLHPFTGQLSLDEVFRIDLE